VSVEAVSGPASSAPAVLAAHEVDGPPVHEGQHPRARLRSLGQEAVRSPPEGEKTLLHGVLGQRLVA
jgi:hypothetical protein